MEKVINKIQVVRYQPGLADAIAKMWNMSRESWGGDNRVMTGEQVKTKEENSDNIELYIALDGEEVVGYCGLSEYKEDEGALYIPLLNVRPDYHGRKIGKLLVLEALEKTVELGWPRLDLYTWPGNTKAVPLYKKCGFFWEDRDDSTHLMNFIPAVLNTPLLKPVFEKLDWYSSSTRKIEVKPDGKNEFGFTYYDYEWEHEGTHARVQFERSGRGMRLIETDEFLAELVLNEHQLIEGRKESISLKIVNKSGNPLAVEAAGKDSGRVKCSLTASAMVSGEEVITGVVDISEGEAPDSWKTHPSAVVDLSINGLNCSLRLGILPKKPADVTASLLGHLSYQGKQAEVAVEVKNNLAEEAKVEIQFPETEKLIPEQKEIVLNLKPKERKSFFLPGAVKKHGFSEHLLQVALTGSRGGRFQFEKKAGLALKGFGSQFGGETEEYWHIFNGNSQVNIRKRDYTVKGGRSEKMDQPFAFFQPKLGKPYTAEFTKKKPVSAEWYKDGAAVTHKLEFLSENMPGIKLAIFTSLYAEGLVKRWMECENGREEPVEQLYISQSMYHEGREMVFPLDGEAVAFSDMKELLYGDVNFSSLSGNWYFAGQGGEPIGLAWPESARAVPDNWQLSVEFQTGEIQAKEKAVLDPLYLSIGAFQSWEEFAAFASHSPSADKKSTAPEKEMNITSVFCDDEKYAADLTLTNRRLQPFEGKLSISVDGSVKASEEIMLEGGKDYKTSVTLGEKAGISIVSAVLEEASSCEKIDEIVLLPGGEVQISWEEEAGLKVAKAVNGPVEIKSAPGFYPGLFSISVNGRKWLDHSFPSLQAKGWWNPWGGGMKTIPSKLNVFSILKGQTEAEAAAVMDSSGNSWQGLKITTRLGEHPVWQGLVFSQYYLMLPGVPLIASFLRIKDAGGKLLAGEYAVTDAFLNGGKLQDLSIRPDGIEENGIYTAGKDENVLFLGNGSSICSTHAEEKLYMVTNSMADHNEAYMNKEACQLISRQPFSARVRDSRTKPVFMLFDSRELSGKLLDRLQKISFSNEETE
ncbi:GNAT family N-acetyltransferase [Bacillus infantis]|uniref:GNAT family N-acetyltransferase n=1 Tax=Bacillus infantis TaxID=324767 RepID=UPI001CD3B474|nr:GNAT family N-acetyltransferase [Bacillus infantis]MCA1039907.1 GNAT family N-acetyltransferase [Bacillus infantis]